MDTPGGAARSVHLSSPGGGDEAEGDERRRLFQSAVGVGEAAIRPRRQAALCTAYEAAGRWQNTLGLTRPVEATRRPFFDRPYPVIDAARFAAALLDRVDDATLAALPPIGAVDQFIDSADVLVQPNLTRTFMTAVYPKPHEGGPVANVRETR
ncbi:hypothetical protein AB1484_35840 [Parafrankia sp. FMc6]|uniref:hypothetical protein n=1 Tax=Parafrankia soli TaxID=2599596 RepID=UPI0034D5AD7D